MPTWATQLLSLYLSHFSQSSDPQNPAPQTSEPGVIRGTVTEDPVATDQNLLRDLYCLWVRGGYGFKDTERSIWLTNNNGNYGSVPWPWSAEQKRETWKGPWPTGAFAIAHTHPNRSPKPSTSDDRGGEGDYGAAKQINGAVYAVTRDAVW